MKNITPKAKQKLMGLLFIVMGDIFGLYAVYVMPEECGFPLILVIIGFYLLFTKKQLLDFD